MRNFVLKLATLALAALAGLAGVASFIVLVVCGTQTYRLSMSAPLAIVAVLSLAAVALFTGAVKLGKRVEAADRDTGPTLNYAV